LRFGGWRDHAGAMERRWLLVLLLVGLGALAPRLAIAIGFDQAPTIANDAGWYDFFAKRISEGHGYTLFDGAATSRWPPGYPMFLAAVYRATGESQVAARIVQALLGAGIAVATAELGRRLIGARAGAIAGVIVAATPSLALYSSLLMSEVLFTWLLIVSFMLGVRRDARRWVFLSGVALGLATLVRAQGLAMAIAVWASWIAAGGIGAEARRPLVASAGVMAAGAVLVIAPWAVRNAVELHTFQPVSTGLGMNLWMGNNPSSTGTVMDAPVAEFESATAGLANPAREVEMDRLARDAALRFVLHHPIETVRRAPRKVWETYRNDRSFAAWYDAPGTSYLRASVRRWVGRACDAGYFALLLLACAGFGVLAVRRSAALALPLSAVVVWTMVSVAFFGDTRYHVPLLPALALPAAACVESIGAGAAATWRGRGGGAGPR